MYQINLFRKLHQASYVSSSNELNQLARSWALQLATVGTERIDPYSIYGQLVCSHQTKTDIVKACAAKWYAGVKFFDWADPKLTVKLPPFAQMVWKNGTCVGAGSAKGHAGYLGKIVHISIF